MRMGIRARLLELAFVLGPFVLVSIPCFLLLRGSPALWALTDRLVRYSSPPSAFIVAMVVLLACLGRFRTDWFYGWLGFSIYFVWFFLFPGYHLVSGLASRFFSVLILSDTQKWSWLGVPRSYDHALVLLLNLIGFSIMIALGVSIEKIFILVFTNVVSFCHLGSIYVYAGVMSSNDGGRMVFDLKDHMLGISSLGILTYGLYYYSRRYAAKVALLFAYVLLNLGMIAWAVSSNGSQALDSPQVMLSYLWRFAVMTNAPFYIAFLLLVCLAKRRWVTPPS